MTFKDRLLSTNWEEILTKSKDPQKTINLLDNKITDLFNESCPLKLRKPDRNNSPIEKWMTPGILISRQTKINLRKEFNALRTEYTRDRHKSYNKVYTKVVRKAKQLYLMDSLNRASGDSKKTWNIANSITNRNKAKQKLPECVNGKTGSKEIAEEFNKFFTEIGQKLASKFQFSKHMERIPTYDKFELKPVEEEVVQKLIRSLKPKASSGADGLSNKILKELNERYPPH